MRRAWALGAAIGLAAVSGCRPQDDTLASAKTLVVWEGEDASVAPYIDSVFDAFQKRPEGAGVRIIRTHYHPEDLRQQFLTASIAGSPPDLILSASDTSGLYAIAGFLLPVNALFDLKAFNKPAVEAATLEGKTWGVPVNNGNHLMLFYNKALVPSEPRTTAQLFAYCEKAAKDPRLKYCMALNDSEPYWLMPWLGAFGGWPINGHTPTLDTPGMRKALAFTADLGLVKHYAPVECDYNCMDALFTEGKVAFIINGDWAISTYQAHFGKDLGVAKIPLVSETGRWPSPMISGKYFMFSSKLRGGKLELARKVVAHFVDEENQLGQVKALKRLPALTKAAESSLIRKDPVLRASMDQILVGRPMPAAMEMRVTWDAIRPFLGKAIQGKISPDEAARKMQQDAMQKIREMDL